MLQQGHLDQAVETFTSGLKKFPRYAPLHSGMSAAKLQRGDYISAYESAVQAVGLRAQNVHYRLQAALASRRSGDVQKAAHVIVNGLSQPGDGDDAMLHQVMAELSMAAFSIRPEEDIAW